MAPDFSAVAKSRVVLLSGEDSLARSEAIKAILEASGAEAAETESVMADAREPSEWFATVSTVPFFTDRRVLLVRSVGRIDPGKLWDLPVNKEHPAVKEMAGLPDTALLLLTYDDEIGDDDRLQRFKRNTGTWVKIVSAAGGKVVNFAIDTAKTSALVRDLALELGKKISPVASQLLSEMVGGKPTLAVSELEKVALYVGDNPEIRETDVRAAVMPDSEYNVYKLGDAVVAGDAGLAVAQLRILFGQTSKVADQVIPRIFPTLLSQFRYIWQARFCLDAGSDVLNAGPDVLEWLPAKRLADEPEWRQRRMTQAARKMTLPKIQACLEVLVQADAEVKGQKPALSVNDSVERMALLMCRICSNRA